MKVSKDSAIGVGYSLGLPHCARRRAVRGIVEEREKVKNRAHIYI